MTEQEIALEKLKIKRNREKFWIGTVVIGIISLLLNNSIQKNKLEHERIKQENEHLSKFVTYAISKDIEQRKDIAEYFSVMSYTKETRDRWKVYLVTIDELIELKFSLTEKKVKATESVDKIYLQISHIKLALLGEPYNSELKNKLSILYQQLDTNKVIISNTNKELKKIESSALLLEEPTAPSWYKIAEGELEKGIKEISGNKHNDEIVKYFKDIGIDYIEDDETPWSSAFINWCLNEVGIQGTSKLNNRSWLDWGVNLEKPKKGCVVIFWREDVDSWKGHAGFYAGDDGDNVLILGGNQNNAVSIQSYTKDKILGFRWPEQ